MGQCPGSEEVQGFEQGEGRAHGGEAWCRDESWGRLGGFLWWRQLTQGVGTLAGTGGCPTGGLKAAVRVCSLCLSGFTQGPKACVQTAEKDNWTVLCGYEQEGGSPCFLAQALESE